MDIGLETNPDCNSNYKTFDGLGVSYAPVSHNVNFESSSSQQRLIALSLLSFTQASLIHD